MFFYKYLNLNRQSCLFCETLLNDIDALTNEDYYTDKSITQIHMLERRGSDL
jgi:hypothetical protein